MQGLTAIAQPINRYLIKMNWQSREANPDEDNPDGLYVAKTPPSGETAIEADDDSCSRMNARYIIMAIMALVSGLAILVLATGTLHRHRNDSNQLVRAVCTVQLMTSARASDLDCTDGTHYGREFSSELQDGVQYTVYYIPENKLVVGMERRK
jgi:hypothetical protein